MSRLSESVVRSSSSGSGLDRLSGAVQASVIYIRIHSVDRLNSSLSQHHRQPNDRRQQWRRTYVVSSFALPSQSHQ